MTRYTLLLCLLICLIAAGCSGNKRLSGKVTFSDGEPAPKGVVIFEKENFISKGEIQPDGSYKLSSVAANDGIPPGEYKVYVTGVTEMPPAPPGVIAMPIYLCDSKFENPETSGLTCKIPAPGNRFDITIERRK